MWSKKISTKFINNSNRLPHGCLTTNSTAHVSFLNGVNHDLMLLPFKPHDYFLPSAKAPPAMLLNKPHLIDLAASLQIAKVEG